jgi:hypothetical protein
LICHRNVLCSAAVPAFFNLLSLHECAANLP